MTNFNISDEVVEAAMSALRVQELAIFGEVKTPDNGARREAIKAAIESVLPVMFESVHQQGDAGGHWSDQHEAVKDWWEGRENAPMFRTVYRIKEPK